MKIANRGLLSMVLAVSAGCSTLPQQTPPTNQANKAGIQKAIITAIETAEDIVTLNLASEDGLETLQTLRDEDNAEGVQKLCVTVKDILTIPQELLANYLNAINFLKENGVPEYKNFIQLTDDVKVLTADTEENLKVLAGECRGDVVSKSNPNISSPIVTYGWNLAPIPYKLG